MSHCAVGTADADDSVADLGMSALMRGGEDVSIHKKDETPGAATPRESV